MRDFETMNVHGIEMPSYDALAHVGYGGIREENPQYANKTDDELAVMRLCAKIPQKVYGFLGETSLGLRPVNIVQSVGGQKDILTLQMHRHTLVDADQLVEPLIVDLVYKQFVVEEVQAELPNVFVGTRDEMADIMLQHASRPDYVYLFRY
jgi:hypothetical protein